MCHVAIFYKEINKFMLLAKNFNICKWHYNKLQVVIK